MDNTYTEAYRKWLPLLQQHNTNNIFSDEELYNLAKFSECFVMTSINTMTEEIEYKFNDLFLNVFYKLLKNYKNNFKYNFVYTNEKLSMETISLGTIKNIDSVEFLYDCLYDNFFELLTYNKVSFNHIFIAKNIKNEYEILVRGIFVKPDIKKYKKTTQIMEKTNEKNNVNFQECAHLEIEDVFATSKNTLYDLYNLQKDIQENVYGYDFTQMQNGPLPELRKFFDWNYHAIQDELREAFNALGGMSDGIGNGVWKPWKKAYTEQAPNMTYTDMSERDKKELKMELIDIQHFLFNLMLSVGMTADELMNYYFAKNAENRRRNADNY